MLLLLLILVPALHEFFRPHEPELRADEDIYGSDYDPDPDKRIFRSGYNPDKDIIGSNYDPDPDEGIFEDEEIFGSNYNPDQDEEIFGSNYNPDKDFNGSNYDPDPEEEIFGSGYDPDKGIIGSDDDPDCERFGLCGDEPACTGEGESVRGDGNCTLRPDCHIFEELCCDSGEP